MNALEKEQRNSAILEGYFNLAGRLIDQVYRVASKPVRNKEEAKWNRYAEFFAKDPRSKFISLWIDSSDYPPDEMSIREAIAKKADESYGAYLAMENAEHEAKRPDMWKGDDANRRTIRRWISENHPLPYLCATCNKKADMWRNISGAYKRDIKDWKPSCRSCNYAASKRREEV